MNCILKGFDGPLCKIMMDRTFKDIDIGTCISTMWPGSEAEIPDIGARESIVMDAEQLKLCHYEDADWNTIPPLDEELIYSMRHCENMFMTMMSRMEEVVGHTISAEERKHQYLTHLRYWNHKIAEKKIDLFLSNNAPHQMYDIVIYDLCRLRGIPTFYIDRCYCIDAFFLVENWEEPGKEVLLPKLKELHERYSDPSTEIPLHPKYEVFYKEQAESEDKPWYSETRSKQLLKKSFISKWSTAALHMARKKPLTFASRVLSPTVWHRKLREHRTIGFYDKHISQVDLKERFIYVPLHMQPEATTCPLAGAFVEQELMVQLLAAHLPPDIKIYVKEHPSQGETMRSERFYQSLLDIPAVRFVPRDLDSIELTEGAIAIATGTGTAAFEGLFRSTPSLLFGHRFFQYANGIHMIHTAQDCKDALHKILEEGEKPVLRDARIFLKAMEETLIPYAGGVRLPDEAETVEQKAEMMGAYMAEKIR